MFLDLLIISTFKRRESFSPRRILQHSILIIIYIITPQHVAENVLNREFKADKPNEKWVTDVTELKYGEAKKAYLSAIRDLYDGSHQLCFRTFKQ